MSGRPYYQDERATIYHGDALAVLPTLAAASFSAVILDPPYSFENVSFRGRDDGAAGTSGAPTMLLYETLTETRRLLADGGIAPVLCQWRRQPDVYYLMALAGLRLSACVAWTRNRIGTGGLFRSSWDPIVVGSKGAPTLRDKSAIPNVIGVEPVRGHPHPYAKPPGLWMLFLSRIPKGGIALDPFAGSGASAVAAISSGHRWVGIESDERWCEATANGLRQFILGMEDLPLVAP